MPLQLPDDEEVQQRLIKSIGNLVASPEVYDAFIKSWQAAIDGGDLNTASISAVESEAASTIKALKDLDAPESGPLALENIGEPAFLLDEAGSIRDVNDMAWERFRVDTGGAIGDLDLEFYQKDALDQALSAIVKKNSVSDLPTMLPCFDPSVNSNLTVLCVKAPPSSVWLTPSVLVIINTGQGAELGAQLLADGYALTKNEHEVFNLFSRKQAAMDRLISPALPSAYPVSPRKYHRCSRAPTVPIKNRFRFFSPTGASSMSP